MRELTACGSCEFVWLDSFDSFIVPLVVNAGGATDVDTDADADAEPNADVAGNGAAAAHVWPKYKKAILATGGNPGQLVVISVLLLLVCSASYTFLRCCYCGCCCGGLDRRHCCSLLHSVLGLLLLLLACVLLIFQFLTNPNPHSRRPGSLLKSVK